MSRYDNMVQTSTVGAISYLAPEVMGGMMHTTHSDVFSFAVCCWEIISGNIPYEKESVMKVHQLVMTGRRLPIPSWVPRPLAEFIATCWREKPENRPSFNQILARISEMILELLTDGGIDDIASENGSPSLKGHYHPTSYLFLGTKNRRLYGGLDSISSALNSCKHWKNGNLEVLVISGEQGVGKTSLMNRLLDFAAVQKFAGVGRWHGRGVGKPYSGISEALM